MELMKKEEEELLNSVGTKVDSFVSDISGHK